MEGMRTLLRGSLKKSLISLGDEDRLAAAWTVVCGKVLSERGSIAGYADGVVQVEVIDSVWLRQMTAIRKQLIRELREVADVPVSDVRFVIRGAAPGATRGRVDIE